MPSFEHHGKGTLPMIEHDGGNVRLILGRAYGETAPTSVFSETFYGDAELQAGARLPLPDDHEDRGVYIVEGSVSVADQKFEAGRMMVFRPKDKITVAAGVRGAPPDYPRRGDARRPALYLVEFRRLQYRANRGRERGMATRKLGPRLIRSAAR